MLLYDRGFFDRGVMLTMDYRNGLIPKEFYENIKNKIEMYKGVVDHPFVFLIPPNVSKSRIHSQNREGGDNSYLCEGMNTMDSLEDINLLLREYKKLTDNYPKIEKINGGLSKEDVQNNILSSLEKKLGVVPRCIENV